MTGAETAHDGTAQRTTAPGGAATRKDAGIQGVNPGQRFVFITLWRLNDWGFYKRRHEALATEFARRDCVEGVIHVEHVSLKGVISLMNRWLREKNRSLKNMYAYHVKKSLSFGPISVRHLPKLYIYSVVLPFAGRKGIPERVNTFFRRLQYRAINKHLEKIKGKRVLIAYPPSKNLPEALDCIDHDLLIADLVDDNTKRTGDVQERMRAVESYKKILPRCSWIFATSASFNGEYRSYSDRKIEFLPNGVDLRDFAEDTRKKAAKSSGRKVAGYIGIINREFDFALLEHILLCHPEANFDIIGRVTDDSLKAMALLSKRYRNLHHVGEKSHDEIPDCIATWDVLMNLKKADHTTAGGESIKIYEYLATGKPIVSTPVPPADRFTDLMYVASDKTRFAEVLTLALEEDDPELRKSRVRTAMENSWEKRAGVILDKVSELFGISGPRLYSETR